MSVIYYVNMDGEAHFLVDTINLVESIVFLNAYESVWIVPGTITE